MLAVSAVPLVGWSVFKEKNPSVRLKLLYAVIKRRRGMVGRLFRRNAFPGKSLLWLQYVRNCPPPFARMVPSRRPCNQRRFCPFCWARFYTAAAVRLFRPAVDWKLNYRLLGFRVKLARSGFMPLRYRLFQMLKRSGLAGFAALSYPCVMEEGIGMMVRLLLVSVYGLPFIVEPGGSFRRIEELQDGKASSLLGAAIRLTAFPKNYINHPEDFADLLRSSGRIRRWYGWLASEPPRVDPAGSRRVLDPLGWVEKQMHKHFPLPGDPVKLSNW